MRRMISQKLQDLLKKLSQSIWADDNGNVEVGKNLEVDGDIQVNGEATINGERLSPSIYSKAKYQHTITFQANDEDVYFCFTCYLSKNTPIDSIQDLTTLLGGAAYGGCGRYTYNGNILTLMRIDVGSSISDSSVVDTENGGYTLSSLTDISITDDVSIPR